MSRSKITTTEQSAAVLLSPEVLEQLGVNVGDEIEVSVVERTLILRSLDVAERARKIEDATDALFERRESTYKDLAKGVE